MRQHDLREKTELCFSLSLSLSTGLPQLPLLYALVSTFKADVSLRNGEGLTPLCLAAKLGEEKLAEVGYVVYILEKEDSLVLRSHTYSNYNHVSIYLQCNNYNNRSKFA